MNDLLNKLSSYHLFNYLLPGCLFAAGAAALGCQEIVPQNLILGFFVFYFFGLVISRLGSLILEPALKGIGFLRFAEYKLFVDASKKDPKIDVLSETNNMYRTLCSLTIVLGLIRPFVWARSAWAPLREFEIPAVLLALLILFLASYKKQTAYISARVEANQGER